MSPAQFRARVMICQRHAESGGCMADAAYTCGITLGALHHWLKRHNPALGRRLAANGHAKPKRRLTEEQEKSRLLTILALGQREAARKLGISEPAVSQWYADARRRLQV